MSDENDGWGDGHVSRLTIDIARSTAFLRELDPITHETLSRSMEDLYYEDAAALGLDHLTWSFTGDGWDVWSGDEKDRLGLAAFALAFEARFHERLERDFKVASLKDVEKPGLRMALHSGSERRPRVVKGDMNWLSDAAVQAARARDVCDPDTRPFVVNQGVYEAHMRYFYFDLIPEDEVKALCKHGETPGTLYALRGISQRTKEAVATPEETPDWLRPVEYVLSATGDAAAKAVKSALRDRAISNTRSNDLEESDREAAILDVLRYASSHDEAVSAYRATKSAGVSVPEELLRRRIRDATTASRASLWLEFLWHNHGVATRFGQRTSDISTVLNKAKSGLEAVRVAQRLGNPSAFGAFSFQEALAKSVSEDDAASVIDAHRDFGVDDGQDHFGSMIGAILYIRDRGLYSVLVFVSRAAAKYFASNHPDTLKYAKCNFLFYEALGLERSGRTQDALTVLNQMTYVHVPSDDVESIDRFDIEALYARVLDRMGRYSEALQKMETLLSSQERMRGEEHPTVLANRYLYILLLDSIGRSVEALELVEDLLKVEERLSGPGHRDTLMTYQLRSFVLRNVGRVSDALAQINDALPRLALSIGDKHPNVLITRQLKAQLLNETGESHEALAEVEDLQKTWERNESALSPNTFVNRSIRAKVLASVGHYGEAVKEAKDVLALAQKREADLPKMVQMCRVTLAECLFAEEMREEARTVNDIALSWYRERVLPSHYWRSCAEALNDKLNAAQD